MLRTIRQRTRPRPSPSNNGKHLACIESTRKSSNSVNLSICWTKGRGKGGEIKLRCGNMGSSRDMISLVCFLSSCLGFPVLIILVVFCISVGERFSVIGRVCNLANPALLKKFEYEHLIEHAINFTLPSVSYGLVCINKPPKALLRHP